VKYNKYINLFMAYLWMEPLARCLR